MDRDQAAQLLEERRPVLLVYIRAIVGARQPCEDILQEAAMICLRKHDEIPDPAAFEGWIRRVCRFEALKHLERHRRERPAEAEQLAILADAEITNAAEDTAGRRLQALKACVERLPPASRHLVQLRYADEHPGEEIARRLGKPINTVYVTLCRLHKALAECVRQRLAQEDAP
jgi:RNA polymerase sigma-70 factor, ECF subfamily